MRILASVILLWSSLMAPLALGQNAPNQELVSTYRSETDELLTIRRLSVLPIMDNVNGIYGRPLEQHLMELIKKDHRWEQADLNVVGPLITPEELEEDPGKVGQLTTNSKVDALLAVRLSRGPKGVTIKMNLFLAKDRKLISQEVKKDLQKFDIASLKDESTDAMKKLFAKIPYSGLVMSRQGLRVTLNLGKRDGIQPGQTLNVVQIINLNRHPKFNFLINTEKEIIGRVKVLKVDDTLSFGQITSEKAKGAIQRLSKIGEIDFVTYPVNNSLSPSNEVPMGSRPDNDLAFGKSPGEWTPTKPASFGMVGARFGLGTYSGDMQLTTPTAETLEVKTTFYPSVFVDAELWMTSDWTMAFALRQGIIPINNPKSGTDTTDLSQSLSSYDLLFSYTIRLQPGPFGTRVDLSLGYSTYRLFVDDTEDSGGVKGLTTMNYNGLKFGVLGKYPVSEDGKWMAGAKFYFFFDPSLKETPISSGSSNNNINQFGFFVDKKLGERLFFRGGLDYELYSSSFSGGRASSASQKHTVASGGVYYLF